MRNQIAQSLAPLLLVLLGFTSLQVAADDKSESNQGTEPAELIPLRAVSIIINDTEAKARSENEELNSSQDRDNLYNTRLKNNEIKNDDDDSDAIFIDDDENDNKYEKETYKYHYNSDGRLIKTHYEEPQNEEKESLSLYDRMMGDRPWWDLFGDKDEEEEDDKTTTTEPPTTTTELPIESIDLSRFTTISDRDGTDGASETIIDVEIEEGSGSTTTFPEIESTKELETRTRMTTPKTSETTFSTISPTDRPRLSTVSAPDTTSTTLEPGAKGITESFIGEKETETEGGSDSGKEADREGQRVPPTTFPRNRTRDVDTVITGSGGRPSVYIPSYSSLYNMQTVYDRCDNCMLHVNSSLTECLYYGNYADDIETWAKKYADVLRYGCHGPGMTQGPRCCHNSVPQVSQAIRDMSELVRELTRTLKNQCNKCPVDCEWGEWSDWSQCPSDICQGARRQYKTRTRTSRDGKFNGRPCIGERKQSEPCPFTQRVRGQWHSWGPWSACSGSCEGVRTRTRKCTDPTACFTPCRGDSTEAETCGDRNLCCMPPVWSEWGAWEECQEDAITGASGLSQSRRRTCQSDPRHRYSLTCWDKTCTGQSEQSRPCEACAAPECVPRQWSAWGDWGACHKEDLDSETPVRFRYRKCMAKVEGQEEHLCPEPCPGTNLEKEECCTNSEWGQWTAWGICSPPGEQLDAHIDTGEPCGNGKGCQNRTRECNRGTCDLPCEGDDIEHNLDCVMKPCCAEPIWTTWGAWEECEDVRSAPGRRLQSRHRLCQQDPDKWDFPRCRSKQCPGEGHEIRECAEVRCPASQCATPSWEAWSDWTRCDFRTQSPVRMRTRKCRKPSEGNPACAHSCCEGEDSEQEKCVCERANWSPWGRWSECYGSDRTRYRRRDCVQPSNPDYCRGMPRQWRQCPGSAREEEKCCTPESSWSSWSDWGDCFKSTTYDRLIRERSRECKFVPGCPPVRGERPNCGGGAAMHRIPCEREMLNTSPGRAATIAPEVPETLQYDPCVGKKPGKYPSEEPGCNKFIVCCQDYYWYASIEVQKECRQRRYSSYNSRSRSRSSSRSRSGSYSRHKRSATVTTCQRGLEYDSDCAECIFKSFTCVNGYDRNRHLNEIKQQDKDECKRRKKEGRKQRLKAVNRGRRQQRSRGRIRKRETMNTS